MAIEIPNKLLAGASIDGVGSLFTSNRGFSSVVRTGLGVYVLTLDQGIDQLNSLVFVSPRNDIIPGSFNYEILRASDDTISITITDNLGANVDADFSIIVVALPVNG